MGKLDLGLPSYMGRIIIFGYNMRGDPAIIYIVEGRSPPSRRRRLEIYPKDGIVRVNVNSETGIEEMRMEGGNPDLLLYNAMKGDRDGLLVVSNGFQTDCDPIWEGEGREKDNLKGSKSGGGIYYGIKYRELEIGKALLKSLEESGSEVDPLRTARIGYAVDLEKDPDKHYAGIVVRPRCGKDLSEFADHDEIGSTVFSPKKGEFIVFATYGVHGPPYHDALPPSTLRPRDWSKKITLYGSTPEELTEEVWGASPKEILVGVVSAMRDKRRPRGFHFAVKNMQE